MNPLFDEVPVTGTKYNYGDWKQYAIHDEQNIKGFFGLYRFLGNFSNCPVFFESWEFPSPEHAYQWAKILPSNPKELSDRFIEFDIRLDEHGIRRMSSKEVKRWGNEVKMQPDWEDIKYDIMSDIIFDKYFRHKDSREQLAATGEKFLEETNHWHDNYWGNCICSKCKDIFGRNKLGIISMKCRQFWK